ncbi:MAG TPA: ABC transporter ATP-binding protein [Bacteroidia bacterium]|nr:ABC transporter ATP-binding protein [Bacteroidia bacterium]
MNIKLTGVGKRFERNWIFRNLSLEFTQGKRYVVIGPNGSGKSTLLKVISGNVTPSEGKVEYSNNNTNIAVEDVFSKLAIVAPYLDVPEEYSLHEIIAFHKVFKPFEKNLSEKEVIDILELAHTKEKNYKHFSSGMKQRVKLGLAVLSQTPLLLLDEPSTALDAKSVLWYQNLIKNFGTGKTIIVFSNNKEEEFNFCEEKVLLQGNS